MVSMRSYDWACKSTAQKTWIYFYSWSCFIAWMYLCTVISAHRLLTLLEFGFVVWSMLKGLLIVAIFPATFLIIALTVGKNHPYKREHHFYQEWATVYTGNGKGGGAVSFFIEDLAALQIRQAVYANEPFYLLRIRLKPTLNYLGKERVETVGLRADKAQIQHLMDWAKGHQLMLTWEPPDHIQRWS
jgi:hypothetical protein